MFDRSTINASLPSSGSVGKMPDDEIELLHRRCGVYTKPEVVHRILDAVGWQGKADLLQSRLLEPAAGNGVFVIEAARRLVASCIRQNVDLKAQYLVDRIRAFELHPREARRARAQVVRTLRALGVHHSTAETCAKSWIVNGDFLLSKRLRDNFTHAVGNPPYIRWSKIPPELKEKYRCRLPKVMIGGDLFLPFLDRALELLQPKGQCGFLCSDRWRYMEFAEGFRQKWLSRLTIALDDTLLAENAFVKNVDSYPTILIASKIEAKEQETLAPATKLGKTLAELGYVVKVGPALGHTPAYVLELDEQDVEPELLRPWIDGSEIEEGTITWRGCRVVAMYGKDGKLIDPKQFPLLMTRLKRFRKQLKQRSIVRNGAPWFRPIDRVRAANWARPKLLIPELAKTPRVAIDRSGAIPSHGVYAIFAPEDDVDALYEKLRDGKLAKALDGLAPKVKGGYVRCYRRFLLMVRI